MNKMRKEFVLKRRQQCAKIYYKSESMHLLLNRVKAVIVRSHPSMDPQIGKKSFFFCHHGHHPVVNF